MAETLTLPGAIDLHVHLREPSDNTSETIRSGTKAALEGGFILVADMPNNPGRPTWSRELIDEKIEIAKRDARIPVAFYAGAQPEADNVGELSKMSERAIGLKLYGDPTTGNDNTYEAEDFREIVAEWHRVAPEKPIMFHSGEHNLGEMIALVAGVYGLKFHVCHVNNSKQVKMAQKAKSHGLQVTSGVCLHHLLKTSHDVLSQGSYAEMKPRLVHQDEAEKLTRLLNERKIDIIESDFAPHSIDAKQKAEHEGGHCYGVPGIEHVLPLLFYQIKKGRLSEQCFLEATFDKPGDILGIKHDPRTKVIWEQMDEIYRLEEVDVVARCGWSPYMGMLAVGRVAKIVIGGQNLPIGMFEKLNNPVVWERGTVV